MIDFEALQAAEDSLRASATPDEARQRLQEIFLTIFGARQVRVAPQNDPEAEWAHRHGRAVVLPEGRGSRLLFPLPTGHLDVRFDTDASSIARAVQKSVDRLVVVMESIVDRRAALMLDGIVDSVPLSLIAADVEGRIQVVNANAEILFGLRRIDVLDEPISKAIPGEAGRALRSLFQAVRKDGRVHDREVAHETFNIGITASQIGLPGREPFGVVFVCRDLRMSRELQRMRDLDALKTDFIHTISHDLKTPLTAILGSIDLLRLDKQPMSASQAELVDIISRGARRLDSLVRDVLSLSRLEHGKVDLRLEAVSVPQLLEQISARLPQAQRPRVRLAGRGTAAADPLRLAEILENLVSNALKYSQEPVDVRIQEDGEFLRVEVADRGIGIRPRDRGRIFEKFYRAQDAQNLDGTGLGLTIARHLAQLHGGKLTFRSRWKKGTTFILELPAWKA